MAGFSDVGEEEEDDDEFSTFRRGEIVTGDVGNRFPFNFKRRLRVAMASESLI